MTGDHHQDEDDDTHSIRSQQSLADADRRWHQAKKSIRRNYKRHAMQVIFYFLILRKCHNTSNEITDYFSEYELIFNYLYSDLRGIIKRRYELI